MIDVLLPFYGDPELLRVAVRSVLEQTSTAWRLVVVDDAYPDESVPRWFEDLDHPQVEYLRNDANLGANANYSRALALARAPYVVVMGADDVMHPGYLETIEATLRAVPGADVVECGVQVIDGAGRDVHPLVDRVKAWLRPSGDATQALSGDRAMATLLHGNWTYFPSLCWRREAITGIGFRPEFHIVQDLALVIDVLAAGGTLAVTPDVVFSYRRHAGSDSAVKTVGGSRFEEESLLFQTLASELRTRGFHRASRAARLRLTSRLHAAALVPGSARRGNHQDVRRLLRHVLR